jgi:hypothetical protein
VDFGEKPVDDVQIDIGRFNKFIGRVGPFVLNYLDESLDRPNVLRMCNHFPTITF